MPYASRIVSAINDHGCFGGRILRQKGFYPRRIAGLIEPYREGQNYYDDQE